MFAAGKRDATQVYTEHKKCPRNSVNCPGAGNHYG